MSTILFMHIPKAGGVSLLVALEKALGRKKLLRLYNDHPGETRDDVKRRLNEKTRVVYGHMAFGIHKTLGLEPSYATVLRHPVDRVVSLYDYWRSNPNLPYFKEINAGMSLHEFIEGRFTEQSNNHMVAMISGINVKAKHKTPEQRIDQAKEHLSKYFSFVGTIETLDRQVAQLKQLLDIKRLGIGRHNVTRVERSIVDAATRRLIEEHNELDLALYHHVREVYTP